MAVFFSFVFLATLTVWVGSIVFFSFYATPILFETSPAGFALRAVTPLTRSFLRLGWICGLLAMIAVLFLPPIEGVYATLRIVVVAAMFLISLYLGFGLGDRLQRIDEAMSAAEGDEAPKGAVADYESLRETAGQLNGSLLLLGAIVVFITAFYG